MVLPKDDIVISGIGGYFPNAANIEEWKQQLFNNEIHLGEKWHKGMYFFYKHYTTYMYFHCLYCNLE